MFQSPGVFLDLKKKIFIDWGKIVLMGKNVRVSPSNWMVSEVTVVTE